MRNVSDKNCTEIQNKHFVFTNFFFENRVVYQTMCINTVERDRPQMAIWRMRIACWTPMATKTHSEYVIIIAFRQLQWVHERASTLRYSTLPVLLLVTNNSNKAA